jgi:hypothetical protein
MEESRTALAVKRVLGLYLVALVLVVVGLLIAPFSGPFLLALLFLVLVFLVLACSTIMISLALMSVMVLDVFVPGFKAYLHARMTSARLNKQFRESSPAGLRLAPEKLERLCPELFGKRKVLRDRLVDLFGGRAALRYLIADQLRHGDCRAGVVVALEPLRVAAYADKLDAVALLRFPDEFARERGLRMFGRLLVVNRYFRSASVAPDLVPGPLGIPGCSNFRPFVAEFLTDDEEPLRALRAGITEAEWKRATHLGRRYLEECGDLARDGRPTTSLVPAIAQAPKVEMPEAP